MQSEVCLNQGPRVSPSPVFLSLPSLPPSLFFLRLCFISYPATRSMSRVCFLVAVVSFPRISEQQLQTSGERFVPSGRVTDSPNSPTFSGLTTPSRYFLLPVRLAIQRARPRPPCCPPSRGLESSLHSAKAGREAELPTQGRAWGGSHSSSTLTG